MDIRREEYRSSRSWLGSGRNSALVFTIRKELKGPAQPLPIRSKGPPLRSLIIFQNRPRSIAGGGKDAKARFVRQHGKSHLFQIVSALHTTGDLARRLNGGKQKSDENADYGNHHQQLHQRETPAQISVGRLHGNLAVRIRSTVVEISFDKYPRISRIA